MNKMLYGYFPVFVGLVLLAGCGGGGGSSPGATKNTMADSQQCIGCHEGTNWKTPGTGLSIVTEWTASTHNTKNGAGCKDCHGNAHLHPASCNRCHSVGSVASNPLLNPDASGMCTNCHAKVNPRSGTLDGFNTLSYSDVNIPTGSTTAYTHFSTGRHGNYVSTNYINNCRKCHNPHDTSFGKTQRKDWAQSGHGSTVSGYVTNATDFKARGSIVTADKNMGPFCVRCHTSTGYVNFVTSNFMNVQALPDLDGVRNNYPALPRTIYLDTSREAINCNVCHSDDGRTNDESAYSGKIRQLGAPNVYFNFSAVTKTSTKIITNVQYQNHYSSNICFPCHAGRGVGSLIKALSSLGNDFTSVTSPGAHDFSGAGILTANVGYEFDGKVYTASTHDTIGSGTGKGPCITCHMNKASETHSFLPVNHDSAPFPLYTTNRTWAQVFSVTATSPAAFKIAALTSLSCNTSGCHSTRSAADLNTAKEGYISALAALNKWQRLVRNVPTNPQSTIGVPSYNATRDSLTYPNAARSSTNWTYLGTGTGPDLMGAAFNHSMLINEPGAYVHNSLYARRIVYDSIYFLCTKATDPVLNAKPYPTNQQLNVADAIFYLTTTTARTLETGPVYTGTGSTAKTKATTTIEVRATIPTQQALNAIQWLYGKPYTNLTAAEKLIRPGGI
jgi:predicted CXXCH cytochrome family protein